MCLGGDDQDLGARRWLPSLLVQRRGLLPTLRLTFPPDLGTAGEGCALASSFPALSPPAGPPSSERGPAHLLWLGAGQWPRILSLS